MFLCQFEYDTLMRTSAHCRVHPTEFTINSMLLRVPISLIKILLLLENSAILGLQEI